jgi:hypothetical protein
MAGSHFDVNDLTPRVQYTAQAGKTQYDIPFPFFEDEDIVIYFDEDSDNPVSSSNYTLVGAQDTVTATGGEAYVDFNTAPAASNVSTITILRDIPVKRTTDFTDSGSWTAKNVNDELDKLTMMIQQIELALDRSVTLDPTDSLDKVVLPNAEAQKVIRWNDAGDALENVAVSQIGSAVFPGSSTDNALIKFDGTDGRTFQNTQITEDDAGNVTISGAATFSAVSQQAGNAILDVGDIGVGVEPYDEDNLIGDVSDALKAGYGVESATLTDGANVALDLTQANAFTLSTTQNFTLSNPTEITGATKGVWFIDVSADASGPYTITLDTEYTLQDGSLAVEASGTTRLWLVQRGAGAYDVIAEALS